MALSAGLFRNGFCLVSGKTCDIKMEIFVILCATLRIVQTLHLWLYYRRKMCVQKSTLLFLCRTDTSTYWQLIQLMGVFGICCFLINTYIRSTYYQCTAIQCGFLCFKKASFKKSVDIPTFLLILWFNIPKNANKYLFAIFIVQSSLQTLPL